MGSAKIERQKAGGDENSKVDGGMQHDGACGSHTSRASATPAPRKRQLS